MKTRPPFVSQINQSQIIVVMPDDKQVVHQFTNQTQQLQIINDLVAQGVALSEGSGWSPAEIFRSWRDQKLVAGNFVAIAWKGPDAWTLSLA